MKNDTKASDPDHLITAESDYVLKDFHFVDGESLPELKVHYRTRNGMAQFCVRNAPARCGLTKYRGKKDAKKLAD